MRSSLATTLVSHQSSHSLPRKSQYTLLFLQRYTHEPSSSLRLSEGVPQA